MYCGYITKVNNIREAPNADKLNLCDVFGTSVIVSKDVTETDLYLYLPSDGQISVEFGEVNNLFRRKNAQGDGNCGGFIDPLKRNIKAINLRGNRSDGLLMPISSLASFGDISALKIGDTITTFNGHLICQKYIPYNHSRHSSNGSNKNSQPKRRSLIINFPEHIDTPQLKFYLDKFKPGDLVTIMEKLEGTSFRSAMLPIQKHSFWTRLFHRPAKTVYQDFCGSRRVTINAASPTGGFYGSNEFRMDIHRKILPHLTPNMEVFGEIVGWPAKDAAPLMGIVDTKCLKEKEFSKTYGDKMIFHYGCEPGTYDFYIYRICELSEDGSVRLEYSTDQIINWCEKRGFKYPPVLWRGFVESQEQLFALAEQHCDGESTLAHHWREGCVLRRDNKADKFDVYKHKNINYKIMKGLFVEGIDSGNISQDILEEM